MIKYINLFLLVFGLFVATPVFAAEIRLDAHKAEINHGEQFLMDVIIHSEESLNAVEGRLVFPADKLIVKEIRDGNSVINFWIERPRIESSGIILFSGITPGGFSGANKSIFSIVFEAKNTGIASVILQNTKALKNDGLGTETILRKRDSAVSIKSGYNNTSKETLIDMELPESFKPIIESDPNVFEGKNFLVFATQDKISGISHYEVKEYRFKPISFLSGYHDVQSPYLLKDQKLKSTVIIRAIDNNGNARVVEVLPRNPLRWYEYLFYWVIIISMFSGFLYGVSKIKSYRRIHKLILIFFLTLTIIPISSQAATLGFSPSSVLRTVGSTFSVSVYVSSADKAMNAASGVVSFPIDRLEVVNVSKTNSVMNLWVQDPVFSNTQGTVNFEGISLNPGFMGNQGTILTITFRSKSAGQATIKLSSGSVLANDGVGTNILNELGNASISIQTIPSPQNTNNDKSKVDIKEVSKDKDSTDIDNKSLLETPIITYYQEKVESGDFIKIQGITNPGVNVEVSLSKAGESVQNRKVASTASGNFVITMDAPSQSGVYTFSAQAVDEAGNKSKETSPFTIIVNPKWFDQLMEKILSFLSSAILIGLTLVGVIVSSVFVWYRSAHVIRRMKRKSREAGKISEKSFKVLREGVANHVAQLKKVKRKLTDEEMNFLEQFEQKLEEVEKIIEKEIKDI
jgi:hypothetical protein